MLRLLLLKPDESCSTRSAAFFKKIKCFLLFFTMGTFLLAPLPVMALEPDEVVVVANKFVTGSVDLARYYMKVRGIPEKNLIRISTTDHEECSREAYNNEIAMPVREFLNARRGEGTIRCLVTVYGVPLRVAPPALTGGELRDLRLKRKELDAVRERLKRLPDQEVSQARQLQQQVAELDAAVKVMARQDHVAAVDSELALVLLEDYPLRGWLSNPYFIGFQQQTHLMDKTHVLMVARLDGPSLKLVRRIIDDSLAAEAKGLRGTAYFDARGPDTDDKPLLAGYPFYDKSLHLAAARIRDRGLMPVVLDDKSTLFQPGEAPDAALYAGWYSHARYIDAFGWVQGAIGYHIASSECVSLRPSPHSQLWCRGMLEAGAAATVGPVAEPFVQAFPVPEVFFDILSKRDYTLVETYFLSLPYLSWQMVLVGDPLYRPFRNRGIEAEAGI
jgi:uncharacterized protein (TIGR03790 family)